MQIGNNRVVSLSYTLTINSGEVVDTATAEQPFTFIHGIGMTLPFVLKVLMKYLLVPSMLLVKMQ